MIDPARVRETADRVVDGPAYQELVPNPFGRLVAELRSWIAELLFDLLSGSAAANAGTIVAVVVVLLVVGLGVVALLGARRRATADLEVEAADAPTASEAAARADEARAAGDHVAAVRRRYGAIVLLLVERDVLPQLPGTTVGEVDAAVVRSAPACAAAVAAAGQVLADIVYGHRPATAADDDTVAAALRAADRAVTARAVAV